MIGIYKITNKINDKMYIGQSVHIKNRWQEHKSKAFLPDDKSYNSALHSAFRKYGLENFLFEVIEECELSDLDNREKYWIKTLNTLSPNGYNLISGGQSNRKRLDKQYTFYCSVCGKEIDKGSASGKCQSCYQWKSSNPTKEELYQLLISSNGNFTQIGKKYSVSGNAIVKWCKKYNLPYHSADYKPTKMAKEKIVKAKKVCQIDQETGAILQIYDSCNSASRALGRKNGSHIAEVCNGILPTAYGYKWQYLEDFTS